MSALDKFMRESRDIVSKFMSECKHDRPAAVARLRSDLTRLRVEVRRIVVHQVKKTCPEIVDDSGI